MENDANEPRSPEVPTWSFGPDADGDALADFVLRGQKTASCALMCDYEISGEPLPRVGERSVLHDSRGAVCVLETLRVSIRPMNEIDEAWAKLEGEGDGSLDFWKREHDKFFAARCRELGREMKPSMLLVCEEFRVVQLLRDYQERNLIGNGFARREKRSLKYKRTRSVIFTRFQYHALTICNGARMGVGNSRPARIFC